MNRRYLRRCKRGKTSERARLGNKIPILKPYLKENDSKTKSGPKSESHFDSMHRNRSIRGKDGSIPISAVVTLSSFVTGLVGLYMEPPLRQENTHLFLSAFCR